MKKNNSLTLISFFLVFIHSTTVSANRIDTIERILNWAEFDIIQYPASTEVIDSFSEHSWHYRYYPDNNIYTGINDKNEPYIYTDDGGLVYVELVPPVFSANNENNLGNDLCVNVFLVTEKQKLIHRSFSYWGGSVSENISKTTYTKISDTSEISESILLSTSGSSVDFDKVIIEKHFKINDNFLQLSSVKMSFESTITGEQSGINNETNYMPMKRFPVKKFCEGQTWNSSFKESGFGYDVIEEGKVIAINELKTTAAGTFNTVRIHRADNFYEEPNSVVWISTEYGVEIYKEDYNKLGELEKTTELISLE